MRLLINLQSVCFPVQLFSLTIENAVRTCYKSFVACNRSSMNACNWLAADFFVLLVCCSTSRAFNYSGLQHPPGVWVPVYSWGRRSPEFKQYSASAVVADYRTDGSPYELMMMYGGVGYIQEEATWLYDLDMKTWQSLEQSPRPSVRIFHTLVTFCSRLVVLFGGADSEMRKTDDLIVPKCKNETWIFNVTRKVWNFLPVLSTSDFIRPRCLQAAAPIVSSTSSCNCKESMLVYGGLEHFSPPDLSVRYVGIALHPRRNRN